ncbi:uncharacterized protein C10orf105-like [Erpetoichthys calabaricus]|uniref:Chromosome 10 open reading frame 105 n=1 Tax=Erpetoichthys calabaricus TaxID=27687 RepID=A0A8C4S8L6_ERPCA|nr:uncharacterized protein C10orf105-like [Erpetoichthys calabaricus]
MSTDEGNMSSVIFTNSSVPAPTPSSLVTLLFSTKHPQSTPAVSAYPPNPDSLPIILAVLCIFLLFASCAVFMALCKPSSLDDTSHATRGTMPDHPTDPSEPQLRLWKRLGSLRRSLSSVHRSRPVSLAQRSLPRWDFQSKDNVLQLDFMESTKM